MDEMLEDDDPVMFRDDDQVEEPVVDMADVYDGIPTLPGTDRKIALLSNKSLDVLVVDDYSHKSFDSRSVKQKKKGLEMTTTPTSEEKKVEVDEESQKSSFVSSADSIHEKEGQTNVYFRKREIAKTLSMQHIDPFTDLVMKKTANR